MRSVRQDEMAGFKGFILTAACLWLSLAGGCGYPSAAGSTAHAPALSGSAVDAAPTASNPNSKPGLIERAADSSPAPERSKQAPRAAEILAGQRPRADRTPTRPGEAEKITFDDLNLGMPADVVFR